MNRYERTRVLVEGDSTLAREMVRELESEPGVRIEVLDDPREELVMMQARETAQGSRFYLGEALVTTCRVAFGGAEGYGFVMGSDRCRAYELAVIDAAFSGDRARCYEQRWEEALVREAREVRAREMRENARVQATKVDFSTMGVES